MNARGIILPVLWFGSTVLYLHFAVVEWLGYPLIPALTTNHYPTLVWINVQEVFWTVLFTIPAMILAMLTTTLIFGLASASRVLYNYATTGMFFPRMEAFIEESETGGERE